MSSPGFPFKDLHDFVDLLEERGELTRVAAPVSVDLEMAEIARRVLERGGPALLFERPLSPAGEPLNIPVAMNLFGSRARVAWALGVNDFGEIGERLRSLTDVRLGGGLMGLLANLPKLREVSSLPPRIVRSAPAQTTVWREEAVDLNRLPILRSWPHDAGPRMSLPLVITRDPLGGDINVGACRLQVLNGTTAAVEWQRHETGARHLVNARKAGARLEVAVAFGGDPALTYAATAPLPPIPGVNAYSLAGFLRSRPVELAKGATVDLEVPARAEIVLEGYVDPSEEPAAAEPFGERTGRYAPRANRPTFRVTAITMRSDPLYPAMLAGRAAAAELVPAEDAYFREASERIFLVPTQLILPELTAYHAPPLGAAPDLLNVKISKEYPGQAYRVASALLGLEQTMLTKLLLISDDPAVNVNDHAGFWRSVIAAAVPGRDSLLVRGPTDALDHSSRTPGFGSKLVIDGTSKEPEEGGVQPFAPNQERPAKLLPSHGEITDQHQHAGGFWFITTRKTRGGQGRHLGEWAARNQAARGVRLIAVLDHLVNPRNFNEAIATMLTNIDPERDVQIVDDTFGFGPLFVVDGTPKLPAEGFHRPWPEKLAMDPAVESRVTERWGELFGQPLEQAERPQSGSAGG